MILKNADWDKVFRDQWQAHGLDPAHLTDPRIVGQLRQNQAFAMEAGEASMIAEKASKAVKNLK